MYFSWSAFASCPNCIVVGEETEARREVMSAWNDDDTLDINRLAHKLKQRPWCFDAALTIGR